MIGPNEFPELLEGSADAPTWSNAWATLQIDMQLLSPQDREKVVDAMALLKDAGVRFDTGMGFGAFDMELDWSLANARLSVRPIRCMADRCDNRRTETGFSPVYWSVYAGAGRTWSRSFCSPACQEARDAQLLATKVPPPGYQGSPVVDGDAYPIDWLPVSLLVHDTSEALVFRD